MINADQTLVRVKAGETVMATNDSWLMTDALYQRYRRAVADKIQAEESTKATQ